MLFMVLLFSAIFQSLGFLLSHILPVCLLPLIVAGGGGYYLQKFIENRTEEEGNAQSADDLRLIARFIVGFGPTIFMGFFLSWLSNLSITDYSGFNFLPTVGDWRIPQSSANELIVSGILLLLAPFAVASIYFLVSRLLKIIQTNNTNTNAQDILFQLGLSVLRSGWVWGLLVAGHVYLSGIFVFLENSLPH